MPQKRMSDASVDRVRMAAIGAVAGLAVWVLADVLPNKIENERIVMFLAALTGVFFAALLAASGPLRTGPAMLVGLVVSVMPSLLFLWASFRFEDVEQFLQSGHPLVAFAVLATLPVPFLIAALGPTGDWRDYPELFNQSWNIVVRYVAAWLFMGLFWGVILLSNALFGIVGLNIIEDFLDVAPVPFLVTGMVLGLALAVVNELADYVSPYLILRLLRLLLPLVLLVVAIFVIMVPVRGLSGLFGTLSAAGVLLAMAIGGITLVSTAIDQSDEEAVTMPFMRLAGQALALALPLLAGLAGYAVWIRVAEYGWSPERLAAASVAGIVLAYGLFYTVAVVRLHRWMGDIRRFNTYLALLVIAVAALWLTPVIDPQRISANDQLSRYGAGLTLVGDVDLWTIGRDWGVAGSLAARRIAEVERDGQDVIQERLAAVESGMDFYTYQQTLKGPQSARMQEFLSQVAIRPKGATVPQDVFGTFGAPELWLEGCERKTVQGNPGCAMVVADFLPAMVGDEVLLATKQGDNWVQLEMWGKELDGRWRHHGVPLRLAGPDDEMLSSDQAIDQIITGEFVLEPSSVSTIRFGETRFMMLP